MDESPATQQPSPIFLEEDGRPLPVFVEACSIVNRPKLVRTLKKAGAEICTDPKKARIILVNSRTYDGRKFIRDWSSDPNTVVLEYTWIAKSWAAGRALWQDDEWGGCLTRDDGLSLDVDTNYFDDEADQVELINKSPLPTPRVTPVETIAAKAKPRRKSQAPDISEPSASVSAGALDHVNHAHLAPHTSNLESYRFMTPESLPFHGVYLSSVQSSIPFQGNDIQIPSTPVSQCISNFPVIQPYQMMQPVSFVPQAMQSTTLQPNNSTQSIHPGTQAASTQPTNYMHPGLLSQVPMPMQFWAQMMGAMLSQSVPQPNPDLFAMSLMDAMRSHGIVPNPQTQGTVMNSQPIPPAGFDALHTIQPSSTQTEPNATSSSRSASPHLLPSISHKGKESASRYPPQVARRSGPRPRSPSQAEPPVFSPSPVKKQKRSDHPTENRGQTLATSVPSPSLSSVESQALPLQRALSQKVFVKDNGEPMTFFVQIDQPNRQNMVTLIKRNGGKIDSSQTSADYAVLYSRSKTFTDLLKSATEAGKTTVGAPFIHDSIQDGTLRDPAMYKLKMLKRGRKRKVQHDSSSDIEELTPAEAAAASMAEEKRLTRNQLQQERRKHPQKKQAEEGNNWIVVKPEPEDVSLAFEQPRIRSPIPPPPIPEQFSWKGRARYSDLEREYALKYIKSLLDRDHLITIQNMANRLYQKIPHHTLKSWTSYISGYALKEEVDNLRKKATVAWKSSKQKKAQIIKEEPREINLDRDELDYSSQLDTELIKRKDEEEDLNAIIHFFVHGGGDEQDEGADQEELWQRLSSKVSCKTANSWAEFYNDHYNVIQERYTKLVAGIDAQLANSEPDILPAS